MLSFIAIWLTWIITYAICSGNKIVAYELPRIKVAHISREGKITFIVERNDLYSVDSLVSIYYCDDNEFEIFLGLGRVENIMSNKQHQIVFLTHHISHISQDENSKKIVKNLKDDSKTRRCTKIKPSIPIEYLGG